MNRIVAERAKDLVVALPPWLVVSRVECVVARPSVEPVASIGASNDVVAEPALEFEHGADDGIRIAVAVVACDAVLKVDIDAVWRVPIGDPDQTGSDGDAVIARFAPDLHPLPVVQGQVEAVALRAAPEPEAAVWTLPGRVQRIGDVHDPVRAAGALSNRTAVGLPR